MEQINKNARWALSFAIYSVVITVFYFVVVVLNNLAKGGNSEFLPDLLLGAGAVVVFYVTALFSLISIIRGIIGLIQIRKTKEKGKYGAIIAIVISLLVPLFIMSNVSKVLHNEERSSDAPAETPRVLGL